MHIRTTMESLTRYRWRVYDGDRLLAEGVVHRGDEAVEAANDWIVTNGMEARMEQMEEAHG